MPLSLQENSHSMSLVSGRNMYPRRVGAAVMNRIANKVLENLQQAGWINENNGQNVMCDGRARFSYDTHQILDRRFNFRVRIHGRDGACVPPAEACAYRRRSSINLVMRFAALVR